MANRLILATHLVAFCRDRGVTLLNPTLEEYAPYFTGPAHDLFGRYPSRRSRVRPTPSRRLLLSRAVAGLCVRLERTAGRRLVVRLKPSHPLDLGDWPPGRGASPSVIFLAGYGFQCQGQLARQLPAIREYFRPVPAVEAEVRSAVATARRECDVLVGVHVRHGDYRTWEEGRWFFPLAQYAHVMRQAAGLFPDRRVRFLMCSDEAQDPAELADLPVAWGPGGEASDLFALAECDSIIGPMASTYARWAAFYGGKPLYPLSDWEKPLTLDSFQVPRELNG